MTIGPRITIDEFLAGYKDGTVRTVFGRTDETGALMDLETGGWLILAVDKTKAGEMGSGVELQFAGTIPQLLGVALYHLKTATTGPENGNA